MTVASVGAGIAQGAANVAQYERQRPEREAQRAEAKLRQESGQIKLEEYKTNAPLRKEQAELELAKTRTELRSQQAANLKTSTYAAFQRYEADGDTKHLNNFLTEAKKNPIGRSNYGDVLRLDPMVRNPETEAMLREEGFTNIDELFSDPDQVKNLVLATNADGSRELVDMTDMYAGTGYAQHMTNVELEQLTKRATLQRQLKGQESAETSLIAKIQEEEGISAYEATKRYYEIKGSTKTVASSAKERIADDIQTANPGMGREEAITQATAISSPPTAGIKDVAASDEIRAELDNEGFFEADLSTPENRRKFGPKVAAIEKLADVEISNEDKRVLRQLRSLTQLGGTAGGAITDAEAGPVDSMIRGVKKYISNEITGTEGVAAYETFRNIFRNALYGASLTKTEVGAFTTAAGSLKEQAGPTLQKLLVQLQDVQEQFSSIYAMNDEYVATYYTGKSLEEVDQIVEALEERVDFFQSMSKETDMKVSATPVEKPSLEEIFK